MQVVIDIDDGDKPKNANSIIVFLINGITGGEATEPVEETEGGEVEDPK